MKKIKPNWGDIFANLLAFCAFVAIGLGLWLCYIFIIKMKGFSEDIWQDRTLLGMAGEFLGGTVGPIWALAGVILFFLALIYQKRELVLQRMELHESRKIMEDQSRTIAIQQFENTFFQLLNFHINAANHIRNTKINSNSKSQNAFDELYVDFKKETDKLKKRRKADAGSLSPSDQSFENTFIAVFEGYKNTFQHYLENYKALLLFIKNKSHDPSFYYNIVKSHFTEQEVQVHFYYIILVSKNPQLIEIIEDNHMFEKINERAVSDVDPYHLQKIDKEAFRREY
ncbi:putative phage abortive infection protein [Ekhidna sp.]|uniref:putative phage abortive infection protein n=1 Tax=Ekhidna sp. TaxID=2608089 RepID=UPI00355A763C